jgi:small subunit ribosomal protein S5
MDEPESTPTPPDSGSPDKPVSDAAPETGTAEPASEGAPPTAEPAPSETAPQAPRRRSAAAGPQRGGRDRSAPADAEEDALGEVVVKINRCATVVKGGRRFSFGALVVVGDRRGSVGVGYGKSTEVPSAVEKGKKIATRAMAPVNLAGGTLPHRVVGRYGASRIVMVPASPGTGVIAGASARAVLELAGVHDVLTKSYGSNSPKNLVRATLEGLRSLVSRDSVERLRGISLAG